MKNELELNLYFDHKARNFWQSLALLASMAGLLLMIGYFLFGLIGILWLGLIQIIFLGGLFQVSPQQILRLYSARPLYSYQAPELYQILKKLSQEAALKEAPQLYLIPSPIPNAFALRGANESVIGLSSALLQVLSFRELSGVMAHEIAHLKNKDTRWMLLSRTMQQLTQLLSNLGKILFLLNLPLFLAGYATLPWLGLLLLILAPSLSTLLALSLSRTREFEADLEAAKISGDPRALAMALRRLDRPSHRFWTQIFRSPDPEQKISPWLKSHPDTKRRIERLLSLEKRPNWLDFLEERFYQRKF